VVSAYCRRHGVERGPMQCRKRWGNLSWDLKKIVAWEKKHAAAAATGDADSAAPERESFWDMRGEQRRARQLPSSFDREVYDAIVGAANQLKPDSAEEMELADDADEHPPSPMMVMPIQGKRRHTHTFGRTAQRECTCRRPPPSPSTSAPIRRRRAPRSRRRTRTPRRSRTARPRSALESGRRTRTRRRRRQRQRRGRRAWGGRCRRRWRGATVCWRSSWRRRGRTGTRTGSTGGRSSPPSTSSPTPPPGSPRGS
uniref:Myb-like domain-containing protein n=1 Tax=Aegilops tauschii subsp. strangulata TaxID=200361 RepID=A0A453GEA5_AEGTS